MSEICSSARRIVRPASRAVGPMAGPSSLRGKGVTKPKAGAGAARGTTRVAAPSVRGCAGSSPPTRGADETPLRRRRVRVAGRGGPHGPRCCQTCRRHNGALLPRLRPGPSQDRPRCRTEFDTSFSNRKYGHACRASISQPKTALPRRASASSAIPRYVNVMARFSCNPLTRGGGGRSYDLRITDQSRGYSRGTSGTQQHLPGGLRPAIRRHFLLRSESSAPARPRRPAASAP